MWKVLVWNMGLGSPPQKSPPKNWDRLSELMKERAVNVALLNEAALRVPDGFTARYSESGTEGRDRRRDNGQPKRRQWSTMVLSTKGLPGEVDARAVGASGRRPNVPFEPSRAGTWIAGTVEAPGIGRITCVSLYGLMDELSDASVHRSLSDISPIFTDPDYKGFVLVGGDLNTSTQWERPELRARDQNLLERFEAYGLVDCLRKMSPGPLDGCTCVLGDDCRHSWTRFDPGHPQLQVDYLFASGPLADRLETCEALAPPEWLEYSDHGPIIASFRQDERHG
jgi:endonuclease/exonuclease/phosphatase family metal-dependent hydrolase